MELVAKEKGVEKGKEHVEVPPKDEGAQRSTWIHSQKIQKIPDINPILHRNWKHPIKEEEIRENTEERPLGERSNKGSIIDECREEKGHKKTTGKNKGKASIKNKKRNKR